ncbi:MAG: amino acid--tRNA ligase-related protein [SAR324 cluster bacterium]
MGTWHADIVYAGRILEMERTGHPMRLRVLLEDRLAELGAPATAVAGLAPGDLIEFTVLGEGHGEGAPRMDRVTRLGGPLPGRPWSDGDALRWRRPGRGPARLALLRLRQEVLRALRSYFDTQDFLEVETPCWVLAPSPEPQFCPIRAGEGFLITSPEFQLKRLLVGGAERLVRIGPAFRGGERGHLHNPEFTLLEWYRAHAEADALAADLQRLLISLVPLAEDFARRYPPERQPAPARLQAAWVRQSLPQVSVAELFRRHLKMDTRRVTRVPELHHAARAAQWPHAHELAGDFDGAFSRLWIDVEAHFPHEPFLVVDWPAPLASLARLKPGDPTVAERVELYAGGIEIANGFVELTDALEQRARLEAHLAQRQALGRAPLPLDEAFLHALEDGMPPSAGMALGVDRLVMLVAGVSDVRDVLPFAADEL